MSAQEPGAPQITQLLPPGKGLPCRDVLGVWGWECGGKGPTLPQSWEIGGCMVTPMLNPFSERPWSLGAEAATFGSGSQERRYGVGGDVSVSLLALPHPQFGRAACEWRGREDPGYCGCHGNSRFSRMLQCWEWRDLLRPRPGRLPPSVLPFPGSVGCGSLCSSLPDTTPPNFGAPVLRVDLSLPCLGPLGPPGSEAPQVSGGTARQQLQVCGAELPMGLRWFSVPAWPCLACGHGRW